MQLARLNARTGDESILITVRADTSHFNPPEVYTTSKRVDDFFDTGIKVPREEVAARMEGYMISGVEGVVRTYTQQLQQDKKDLALLVIEKLREYKRLSCRGRPAKRFPRWRCEGDACCSHVLHQL